MPSRPARDLHSGIAGLRKGAVMAGIVETWHFRDGEIRMWLPAHGIMCCRSSGDLPEAAASPYLTFLRRIAATAERLQVFDDLEQTLNYHAALRARLSQAMALAGTKIEAAHVLVASKAATLGIQLASPARQKLVAYSSREQFEAALAAAMARTAARLERAVA